MASQIESQNASSPQPVNEDMPLIGNYYSGRSYGVGDASQPEGSPLYRNLYLGTAILAQAGIILLTAAVWASVFLHDVILFSYHPLLNSAGIFLLTEAILILQPTRTASQKRSGTVAHALLNGVGFIALIAGLIVIEYNKFAHKGAHFKSNHAILGFVTYIILVIQTFVGFTQYYTPSLYGSVSNAKAIYKYHRASGYVALVLMLGTVATATKTTYNVNVLHLKLWVVLTTSILVLVGIIPRIKLYKLGLKPRPAGL